MLEEQRRKIAAMRQHGATFAEIEAATGVRASTVRAHCWRFGVTPESAEPSATAPNACLNCGTPIVQTPKQKPKKFCHDKCREIWWNVNRACSHSRSRCVTHCAHCGCEFTKYTNSPQRFCQHSCYIAHRYGMVQP